MTPSNDFASKASCVPRLSTMPSSYRHAIFNGWTKGAAPRGGRKDHAVDEHAFGSAPQPQSVLGLVGEFGSDRSWSGDKDHAMKVGISLTSNYPDVKDPRQGARWMIERAA